MTRLTRSVIPGSGHLLRRSAEDDDVTAMDVVEAVAQLVDQDAVPDQKRRLHGRRGDEVGLDDVGPHADGHTDGHGEDDEPLDGPPALAAGPGWGEGRL